MPEVMHNHLRCNEADAGHVTAAASIMLLLAAEGG